MTILFVYLVIHGSLSVDTYPTSDMVMCARMMVIQAELERPEYERVLKMECRRRA